ncbi:helix-hairpin-helix domain-containing protein [Anoxybacteroides tepidamans]|uniref:helix-hairpin-helix domain-containing protein n=1 Tax=Anoxybacteroides tepidamans TaxID=265948 RepID=UPI000485F156|nr:helix-hairpin-helix domain-containing protein [Anoxybacillus tepidamans]
MEKLIHKYGKRWYVAALAIFLMAIAFIYYERDKERPLSPTMPLASEKPKANTTPEKQSLPAAVIVDIKGAVVHPGIYEVTENARVHDVVIQAGGFTKDADQTKINLAAKVHDEMMIYVPMKGETNASVSPSPAPTEEEKKKIDINSATLEELEQIEGIGPAKAAAIIEYREKNGPFRKIEDLLNVSGIGEKSLEKMKEQIMIR